MYLTASNLIVNVIRLVHVTCIYIHQMNVLENVNFHKFISKSYTNKYSAEKLTNLKENVDTCKTHMSP